MSKAGGFLALLPVALSAPCRAVLLGFTATHCLRSTANIVRGLELRQQAAEAAPTFGPALLGARAPGCCIHLGRGVCRQAAGRRAGGRAHAMSLAVLHSVPDTEPHMAMTAARGPQRRKVLIRSALIPARHAGC